MSFQASYFVPPPSPTVGIRNVQPINPITVGQAQSQTGQIAQPGPQARPGMMGQIGQSFSGGNFTNLWSNGWFYVAMAAAMFGPGLMRQMTGTKGTTGGRRKTTSGRRATGRSRSQKGRKRKSAKR